MLVRVPLFGLSSSVCLPSSSSSFIDNDDKQAPCVFCVPERFVHDNPLFFSFGIPTLSLTEGFRRRKGFILLPVRCLPGPLTSLTLFDDSDFCCAFLTGRRK